MNGEIVRGVKLSGSQWSKKAYVKVQGFGKDIMLPDFESQNRSLHGDTVLVKINPKKMWIICNKNEEEDTEEAKTVQQSEETPDKEEDVEDPQNLIEAARALDSSSEKYATGKVVAVAMRPDVSYVGFAKFGPRSWQFVPLRKEMQQGCISRRDEILAKQFSGRPPKGALWFVSAKYVKWDIDKESPDVAVVKIFGDANDPLINERAIIEDFGITDKDYSEYPEIQQELQKISETISMKEKQSRVDLREKCIFTIDPITARDLDDALSCRRLPDDTFEVGVHIADVSHYVLRDSELDKEARSRLSSFYFTRRVIPMLPQKLSNNLCSLNPGVDRLAFSVIWKMDKNGNVLSQWIGRTIIRSCCKMNYNLAGAIIDGKCLPSDDEKWSDEFADIAPPEANVCLPHKQSEVVEVVKNLMMLSEVLHEKRFKEGGMTVGKTKLSVKLDETRTKPVELFIDEEVKSHSLVEEMMLLANRCVASRIAEYFPDNALLRFHPSPNPRKLTGLVDYCLKSNLGELKTSSSKELRDSLASIVEASRGRVPYIKDLLSTLLVRYMSRAEYFCTGLVDKDCWGHWALNFDRYTHFTSPIRRYPDIIVHRLLEESLRKEKQIAAGGPVDESSYSQEAVSEVCAAATKAHLQSRRCSDLDTAFYLCKLLDGKSEAVHEGLVYDIKNHQISVFVPQYGMADDVVLARSKAEVLRDEETGEQIVKMQWKRDEGEVFVQTIRKFDLVPVAVLPSPKTLPRKPYIVLRDPANIPNSEPLPTGIPEHDDISY